MITMIELEDCKGNKCVLNAAKIIIMYKYSSTHNKNGTKIIVDGDLSYYVKESVEKILYQIEYVQGT